MIWEILRNIRYSNIKRYSVLKTLHFYYTLFYYSCQSWPKRLPLFSSTYYDDNTSYYISVKIIILNKFIQIDDEI